MDKPVLVEVRYKSFSDLDYVSGEFYIFDIAEVPHPVELLNKFDDTADELTIRIVPVNDMMVMAKQLINDDEVQALYDMFEIDPFEDTVIVEDDTVEDPNCTQIDIIFVNNIDKRLTNWYKEIRNDSEI